MYLVVVHFNVKILDRRLYLVRMHKHLRKHKVTHDSKVACLTNISFLSLFSHSGYLGSSNEINSHKINSLVINSHKLNSQEIKVVTRSTPTRSLLFKEVVTSIEK